MIVVILVASQSSLSFFSKSPKASIQRVDVSTENIKILITQQMEQHNVATFIKL